MQRQRAFVDTNVLVYLFDGSDPAKREQAKAVLLDADRDLVISAQVLNEFFVVATRKLDPPLTAPDAAAALDAFAELEVVPVTRNLVLDAVETGVAHQLSHWDALIIEAASRSGCATVLTEDLTAGATIQGVEVVNPFDT